jgi:hypothetical protein
MATISFGPTTEELLRLSGWALGVLVEGMSYFAKDDPDPELLDCFRGFEYVDGISFYKNPGVLAFLQQQAAAQGLVYTPPEDKTWKALPYLKYVASKIKNNESIPGLDWKTKLDSNYIREFREAMRKLLEMIDVYEKTLPLDILNSHRQVEEECKCL